MPNLRLFYKAFILFALASSSACQADDTSSSQLLSISPIQGLWQVSGVLHDHSNPHTTRGLSNDFLDPKYLGRILTITPDKLVINTHYDEACAQPQLRQINSTADQLIKNSIATRLNSDTASSADLKLPLKGSQPVIAYYLLCDKTLRAKDPGMTAFADLSNVVWFIKLDDKQLAMSWHDQTILLLNRLNQSNTPIASFNCSKASTKVEQAICASHALAAYDASLSQAYNNLSHQYRQARHSTDLISELKTSQRNWLKQRDACGDDKACLERVMSIRVDDLVYEFSDHLYRLR